jgi:hypothetical protein
MYDRAAMGGSSALAAAPAVGDHQVMPRRKRFVEEWEVRPDEKPPESEPDRDPGAEKSEEEEDRQNLPEAVLALQGAIGNRALSRALLEQLKPPGAPELEFPQGEEAGLESMVPEALKAGFEDLAGRTPAEQVSTLMAKVDALPPETQELLRQTQQVVSSPSFGKFNVDLLKTSAHGRLGALPDGSKLTDPHRLVDRLCNAIGHAWTLWSVKAHFKDVLIMGPTASGGEIEGPPMAPWITSMTGAESAPEHEAVQAVGGALDESMKRWMSAAKLPGLPIYPAFAAFPGPMAPPMPNVPFPLLAIPNPQVGAIMGMSASGRAKDPGAVAVASAVLAALGVVFPLWTAAQTVQLMLGRGPVPTFAPPYVPVGPVVGGEIIPIPGHFIS